MSFVSVVPDVLTTASGNLANLGSELRSASASAAGQTTTIAAAAADEVSAAITAVFGTHAQEFQALSAEASTFHDQFVSLIGGGAAQYVGAEVANAQQVLVNAVNAPAQALLGHPLIGTATAQAISSGPLGAASEAIAGTAASYNDFNISTPLGPLIGTFTANSGSVILYTGIGPFGVWGNSTGAVIGSGMDGPLTGVLNAVFPFGNPQFGISGNATSGGTQITYNSGYLSLPFEFPALAALAGPTVTGTVSLVQSGQAFFSAVHNWDFPGAAKALVLAPVDLTGAVLVGHYTANVWVGNFQVGIPFGGVFASLEPVNFTVATTVGQNYVLEPSSFALQGTRFGGIVPQLLNAIGLPV